MYSRKINDVDSDITFEYTEYDNVGNRKNMLVNGDTHSYTYDKLYQLTRVDYPAGFFCYDANYYYDEMGNRKHVDYFWCDEDYSLNSSGLNQYGEIYGELGEMDVEYDLNGNMTSFIGREYTYDAENRLTDIDTGLHYYAYDYQGRRISKTVSGVTTKYCYDGSQIIAEYSSAGTLLKKYIYGTGIDEPACMLNVSGQTETKYFYHFDGLGSVIALSNASGNVVESYKYDVFGEPVVYVGGIYRGHLGSVGNRFMFTGREWDNESGLYYYRARIYSPQLGRFLQPDPIGYADSMNLYQYCGNNPVNFVDPSGLSTVTIETTDGKVILNDPTMDQFRNAVKSQKDCSINKITITGHGNRNGMMIVNGRKVDDGSLIWMPGMDKVRMSDNSESIADFVRTKLAPDSVIELNGCNTAREGLFGFKTGGGENITKQLSRELPGTTVIGNKGGALGNDLWRKGGETKAFGFKRKYHGD